MIWLSLRLAFADGRRSLLAALIMCLAVAGGTTVLLAALSVGPAIDRRAERSAWFDNDVAAGTLIFDDGQAALIFRRDRYLVQTSGVDYFEKDNITIVQVAAQGANLPRPPGLARLPQAGEAYISPEIAKLRESSPIFARRYPKVAGILPASLLPGPDSLVIFEGTTPKTIRLVGAVAVTAYPSTGFPRAVDRLELLLLTVGTVSLLFPLVLLIGSAANLASASRLRRFAALCLAGATQRQIAQLAIGESLLIGGAGTALGFLGLFGLRSQIAQLPYNGTQWFPADIRPSWLICLGVALLVPVLTAMVTQQTLLRLGSGRIGRLLRPGRVGWWRALPIALVLGCLVLVLQPKSEGAGTGRALGMTFAALLGSLLYFGPYLTHLLGRVLRRGPRPASLLAGARLVRDPQSGFLAIAGVVIAVLIATLFAAANPAASESVSSAEATGITKKSAQIDLQDGTAEDTAQLLRQLRHVPGVQSAVPVFGGILANSDAEIWVVSCADFVASTRVAAVTCPAGPAVLSEPGIDLPPNAMFALDGSGFIGKVPRPGEGDFMAPEATGTLPASQAIDLPDVIIDPKFAAAALPKFRPSTLVLSLTAESNIEEVRTLVRELSPTSLVQTRQSTFDGFSEQLRALNSWIRALLLVVFGISAFGLIIALAVGLVERRRPFALLRAAGTPVRTLKFACYLEVLLPLVAMSGLAALLGGYAGRLLVAAGKQTRQATWPAVVAPTAAGLVVALILLSLAMLLVNRVTTTEETRFD